jgi:hypothetical protein
VLDPDQTMWARFAVSMTNINFDNAVTFRYTTSNGSATSGSHYVAASNVLVTIPIGEGEAEVEVQVLKPAGATGDKTFTVTLSSPVNCSFDDSVAVATIKYGTGGPIDPPDPPDPTGPSRIIWDSNNPIVYDQFSGQNRAYTYACTGAAVGSSMSALLWREKQQNIAVDWEKLYRDAGGCLFCNGICAPDGNRPAYCTGCGGCNGENPVKMLDWLRVHGVKERDSARVHKARAEVLNDANDSMTQIRQKIKNALVATGAVYMLSKWYGGNDDPQGLGWNRCFACNDYILRNPVASAPYGANNPAHNSPPCSNWSGNFGSAPFGHTWTITGWNNNKANGGAFQVQHSSGRDWGQDGRGWMPYSYMGNGSGWRYYKMIYTGQS